MEDVLEGDMQPPDPDNPLVCMDECPKQLLEKLELRWPGRPGSTEEFGHEYKRIGTRDLAHFFGPT
jgi:hypothetical protein